MCKPFFRNSSIREVTSISNSYGRPLALPRVAFGFAAKLSSNLIRDESGSAGFNDV
jgi:hypothetical protein